MKGVLFTYIMTVLGAGMAPFYPFVGLVVYIMFAVLYPPALWYYSLPTTFMNSGWGYSELVAYPVIVGWLINGCGDFRLGKAKFSWLCLAGFTLWSVVSLYATDWSPMGQNQILMFLRLFLTVTIMVTLCNSLKMLRWIVWAIIFGSGYVAYELNVSWVQGFDRLQMVGYAGMDNNFFAVSMLMGTVIAFFEGISQKSVILKLIAFVAALLQAHAILFSMSRGGMLGLCVVGMMTFLVLPKTSTNILAVILGLILALQMAGPSVRARFATTFLDPEQRDASANGRIEAWKRCITVMSERPLFGVGARNWLTYTRARFGVHLEAHSTWMQMGVDTGIPGLIFQAGFFVGLLWYMLPYVRGMTTFLDPLLQTYGQMTFVAVVGYCVTAQFVSLYMLECAFYTCGVGMVVLKLAHLHQLAEEEKENQQRGVVAETEKVPPVEEAAQGAYA